MRQQISHIKKKSKNEPTTVGVEPTTFWSEVRRANPLRYAVLRVYCLMIIKMLEKLKILRAGVDISSSAKTNFMGAWSDLYVEPKLNRAKS